MNEGLSARVMKYTILSKKKGSGIWHPGREVPSRSVDTLEYLVNKYIEKGWRPVGPAQMVYDGERGMIGYQTMVKDEDDRGEES